MSFYGLTYNYDKDINELQQKINILRQQIPKPEPQNDLHELHHYINIKTIGKTILESILSMQYVGRSISKYVKRQCIAPVEEQIRPVKEVYDQVPDAITEIKDIATEEMSFRQRYVLCGLAAMLVCIRGLGRRKGTVFRPLGLSALTFCGTSWLFVPEFNAKWTNLITQQVL